MCPQIIDWVNFIRPVDDSFVRSRADDIVVFDAWQVVQDDSGATRPECWARGLLKPDGHTVSVSDIFFIAHRQDRLHTAREEVLRIHPKQIETVSGSFVRAGVLIKCIGFSINEGCEKLLGRSHRAILGEKNLYVTVEGNFDRDVLATPSGSGLINHLRVFARLMLRAQSSPDDSIPHLVNFSVRVNHFAASANDKALKLLAQEDPDVHLLVKQHVDDIALLCNETMSPAAYVASNEAGWTGTHDLLLGQGFSDSQQWRYPYALRRLFSNVRLNAPQSSLPQPATRAQGGVTPRKACSTPLGELLKEVLANVNEIADRAVDVDTPLLDAGFDSIAATELSRRLSVAFHEADVPAVIVFEAPTVRQLAAYVGTWHEDTQLPPGSGWQGGEIAGNKDAALCGWSLCLPKGAAGVRSAWHVVSSAQDLMGEVPAARWTPTDEAITSSALTRDQLEGLRHAGFVESAQCFDNRAFGISPAEASTNDPQQRLLLEHGYEALHASELRRHALSGSQVGVFVVRLPLAALTEFDTLPKRSILYPLLNLTHGDHACHHPVRCRVWSTSTLATSPQLARCTASSLPRVVRWPLGGPRLHSDFTGHVC